MTRGRRVPLLGDSVENGIMVMKLGNCGGVILLLLFLQWGSCNGLSRDGWVLLAFKWNLQNSADVLHSWNECDQNPCHWTGVRCDVNKTHVTYLNLPHRQLSGTISPELGKLNHLRRLGLHENRFIGPIPGELRNLTVLRALYLKGNTLTGHIPSEFGELWNLQVLDVSRNGLTGTIPASLGNLHKLQFLNLSSNSLFGEIPSRGSLSNFSSSSFEGNKNLCGPQLKESCQPVVSAARATAPEVPGAAPNLCSFDGMPPQPTSGSGNFLENCHPHKGCCTTHITPQLTVECSCGQYQTKPSLVKFLNNLLLTITALAVVLGILSFSAFFVFYKKHRRGKASAEGFEELKSSIASSKLVMFHGDLPYASKDILKKIEMLNDTDVIGSGGFGTVYRLVMEDGCWFAVKKIVKSGLGSECLFERELEILGSFKHRNLVNLRGYCNSPFSKLLIYDYLPHGSLDEFLHERAPHEIPLNWAARLKIAVGSARALAYLHHDCCPRIIHRDIKSSNILLDDNLEPHVSDFGLAKLLDDDESHVTTIVAGTFGYLAPEYMHNGRATEKGDVYSYGVVLLELLSGRRPTDICFVEKGLNVVGWVGSCIRESRHKDIFDAKCPGAQKESMENVLQIAVMCIAADPKRRPSMEQVTQMLETDSWSPCPSDLENDFVLDKEHDSKTSLL